MLGEGSAWSRSSAWPTPSATGDRIYAVLRASAPSDGRSKSVYAPVSEGQAQALRRAYDQAGYAPTPSSWSRPTAPAPRPAMPPSSKA
jgi:hypothetical protein